MSTSQTTLPSVLAAEKFLNNEPGGLRDVVMSMLGRASIIAVGLLVVGERRKVVKYALAGAAAIETFVLFQVKAQLDRKLE